MSRNRQKPLFNGKRCIPIKKIQAAARRKTYITMYVQDAAFGIYKSFPTASPLRKKWGEVWRKQLPNFLDFAASKYPNANYVFDGYSWNWDTKFDWDKPFGEYSPKGTDEIADANNQDGDLHGDNNTSFEVDNSVSSTPQGGKNSTAQQNGGTSPSDSSHPQDEEDLEGGATPDTTNFGDDAKMRENLPERALSPTQRGEGRKVSSSQTVNAGEQVDPEEALAELDGIQNVPSNKIDADNVTQESEGGLQRSGHASMSGSVSEESQETSFSQKLNHPQAGSDDAGDAWLQSQKDELNEESKEMLKEITEMLAEAMALANGHQLFAELAERQSATSKEGLTPKGRKGRRSTAAFYALENGATVSRKIIARVRQSLEGWLADFGDEDTAGRKDLHELAWRSKALSGLGRALKIEIAHPALLVLCDVSGSCLGFAEEALKVAQAIAEIGMGEKDVIIVTHTNGLPYEYSINGSTPKRVEGQFEYGDASYYVNILKKHSITHVLALGDSDAFDVYQALASSPQVESLLWLDNYACNSRPITREHWKDNHPKIRYVIGCKDASDFSDAIRVALKGR